MSYKLFMRDKYKKCKHEFSGYQGGLPYFQLEKNGVIDGINREHLHVYARCDLCNEKITIGMVHKPD